jgi:hypothetical protein
MADSKSETQNTKEADASEYKISSKLINEPPPAPVGPAQPESGPIEESKFDEIPLEASNRKIYWIGFILLILIFSSTAGIFYLRVKVPVADGEAPEKVEEEAVEVAEESVATLTPVQLARSEIYLEILNGSGISGLAGDTANEFEELGYRILETGNAELSDSSQVFLNPEVSGKADVLLQDLEDLLNIASISGELENSTASARIILGRE